MKARDRGDVILTPWHQRVADIKQRQLPVLVWLVCVSICVWILLDRTRSSEYIDLPQSVRYEVSAPTVEGADTVFVGLYEPLGMGEIVIKLEDSEMDARLERAQSSIHVLRDKSITSRYQVHSASE